MEETPEETPSAVHARFYIRPVVDKVESLKAGRTKHKDGVYVEISTPGDKNSVVDRAMRDEDKGRWPRAWAAFEAGRNQDDEVGGTLLSVWGLLSVSQVEDYRYLKVRTVEQLAALSDDTISKLGIGTRQHRKNAQEFLDAAKSRAPLLRSQVELEAANARIASLEAALKQQGDRLELVAAGQGLEVEAVREVKEAPVAAEPKKARGRPKKTLQAQEA